MSRISCEVYKCSYNYDGGCRLGSIKVDGDSAEIPEETVCDSYSDEKQRGYVNCTPNDYACNNSYVECDARDCRYNNSFMCAADRINIGCAEARCRDRTECMTFRKS